MRGPLASRDSIFKVFCRILRHTTKRRRNSLVGLTAIKIAIGLWESLTLVWIASFATWMVNPRKIDQNPFYKILAKAFSDRIPSDQSDLLIVGTLVLVILVLVKNITSLISVYFSTQFSVTLQAEIGADIINMVFTRPYSKFLEKQPSDFTQIFQWRMNISGFLGDLLTTITRCIVLTAMLSTLILYNMAVSFPVFISIALIASLFFFFAKPKLDSFSVQMKSQRQSMFREVSSSINGYKDIRVLGAVDFLRNRLGRRFNRIRDMMIRLRLVSEALPLALEFLSYFVLAIAVFIATQLADMEIGDTLGLLAMLAFASWKILPIITGLLGLQTSLRAKIPYISSVLAFLEENEIERIETDRVKSKEQEMIAFNSFQNIQLNNVRFRYPKSKTYAINGINLVIEKRERVGIIGASGGGKTTLIDLICGLLDPDQGTIIVNGILIDEVSRSAWMDRIGYLTQNPYIFPGSIDENIAFGVPDSDRSDKKIESCLEQVLLEELGYRHRENGDILLESGINISGGQAQRLALARLLYSSYDFAIIDEGTSSLDFPTERSILENVVRADPEQTFVIVTHRIDTLLNICSRIIWVEDGRIHLDGSPERVVNAYRDEHPGSSD